MRKTLLPHQQIIVLTSLSIMIISYGYFVGTKEVEIAYASGNPETEKQTSEAVINLRSDIEGLYRDINEAETFLGQGVKVKALVLNDNEEELKRLKIELKVKLDNLNALVYPELKERTKSTKKILRGVLEGKENVFYTCFNTVDKANFAMAIATQESGAGTSDLARDNFNFYGIKIKSKWAKFSSIEEGICKGAKANIGIYLRQITENTTRQDVDRIFKGIYCTDKCDNWESKVWSIYRSI